MKFSETPNFPGETRVLAIDFGLVRVGLALSDPLKIIASPYLTIPNDNGLFDRLKELILKENVKNIILGDPGERKSNEELRKKILLLKKQLELLGMEVTLWDESYTSEMATQMMRESVTSKKKRRNKGLIDMNAAVIILQEYLRTI